MSFYSKESKPCGFVVYSRYGCMSHILMNEYGVVFSVNPVREKDRAKVFATQEEAESRRDEFYNCVSSVVLVAEFEKDHFVSE